MGNSITKHDSLPAAGWLQVAGMAASQVDSDYVHQTIRRLGEKGLIVEALLGARDCDGCDSPIEAHIENARREVIDENPLAVVVQLGEMVISHTYLTVPFYWGAVALETFAFAIAFLPRWHRLGALALILMHVGIFLTMNVTFASSILLLVILFFASPLTVESKSKKSSSLT